MTVKCANHGRERVYHENISEVRNCFLGRLASDPKPVGEVDKDTQSAERAECAVSTNVRPSNQYERITTASAKLIDQKRAYYAVGLADDTKFYCVDKPQEGRWAGFVFVKVQASDNFYPIKNYSKKAEVLEAIAADPQAALLRYGKELGKCGHCHRTLTNTESREYGIGPICRAKMEW